MNIQIRQAGSNRTELRAGDTRILFSYDTPVAGFSPEYGYFKTETFHSVTTSRHVNQWLKGEGKDPKAVSKLKDSDIGGLVGGAS